MTRTDNNKPIIGKAAIESLSIAMYDAPFFIYREYVQNSADSIDHALTQEILSAQSDGRIFISVDKTRRRIVIEDNGTGIEAKLVRANLGNIAQSTKSRYEDKGFRGIGRLGGLGYCDTLTYETSSKGENIKSIMTWDAKNLRSILDDPDVKRDASEVVSIVTGLKRATDGTDSHYLRITLDGVSNDELLDTEKVKAYLSMVAPLPFNRVFSFNSEIYKQARKEKIRIDEYNVFLNEEQQFKGFKNIIFKSYKGDGQEVLKEYDTIYEIQFFKSYFEKDLIYWGWYGITRNMKYIPDVNNEKYIRLRKNNIQIGLKSRLDEFHKKESGSQYFIGEVYAVHRELLPNARRDFFIENPVLTAFTENMKKLFEDLHNLYYDFSKKNSAFSRIDSAEQAKERMNNKLISATSSNNAHRLKNDYLRKSSKVLGAQESLLELYYKHQNDALGKIISERYQIKELESEIRRQLQAAAKSGRAKIEDKLGSQEQSLLDFITGVINATYAKNTSEKLIAKIRREIQNNYV